MYAKVQRREYARDLAVALEPLLAKRVFQRHFKGGHDGYHQDQHENA